MISRRHITILPTKGWKCGHLEIKREMIQRIHIYRVRLLVCDSEHQASLSLSILHHHPP